MTDQQQPAQQQRQRQFRGIPAAARKAKVPTRNLTRENQEREKQDAENKKLRGIRGRL